MQSIRAANPLNDFVRLGVRAGTKKDCNESNTGKNEEGEDNTRNRGDLRRTTSEIQWMIMYENRRK